ncbi:cyclic nucleotide-binding domain-containing protein, partial [Aphanothece microscopica]|uniref:cyclic nucleotide-binding domain-containing protein n=1 Tax=Aphanothece microscopica TaxID=1049561 RepID=UPI003984DE8F
MTLPMLPDGQDRRLAAGEILFRAGDPAIGLVLVRRGALELRRVSAEGRGAVLHRAGPGESFAEASLFQPAHHCDGVAVVASVVTIHPAASLRQ